jgi:GT2 family glycosyltransferase
VDYSIVIPVFNREDLTRQCLATLPPTLAGAGTGETIVVDNGSDPATAAVLAEFPWVRVIRNERNLGFAAACNQGARAAQGRIIVHLNNDTVATNGWLAHLLAPFADPTVGITGAKLLFPNGTIQHAGVVAFPNRLGPEGLLPYHLFWGARADLPGVQGRLELDAVTGACLATPRDLFLDLGGFDEAFWNGYEDVDYCYRVRARGLRIMYEPAALLTHFESQSGIQRKRRLAHNMRELAQRWSRRMAPDDNAYCDKVTKIRREVFVEGQRTWPFVAIPRTQIFVHGPEPADPEAFHASLFATGLPVDGVAWCAEGRPPAGLTAQPWQPILGALIDGIRTDRYVAVVDTRTRLSARWLHELINAVEYGSDVCAATALPPALRAREHAADPAARAARLRLRRCARGAGGVRGSGGRARPLGARCLARGDRSRPRGSRRRLRTDVRSQPRRCAPARCRATRSARNAARGVRSVRLDRDVELERAGIHRDRGALDPRADHGPLRDHHRR